MFSETSIGDVFADEGLTSRRSILDEVEAEWNERNHMGPGRIPAGWRIDRLLYRLGLPPSGWFVDVCSAASIAILDRGMRAELDALEIERLTVGHLLGEDRELTTAVAEWIWSRVLDDGSLPHGIVYPSKHGTNWTCWAIWLRAVDDGHDLSVEPTTSDDGAEIKGPHVNAPLKQVVDLLHLRCF